MKYEGNLEIRTKADATKYAKVTEVSGDVRAYQGATLTLPKLEKSGDVRAYQGATLTLPECKEVSGYVYVYPEATLLAPKLYLKGFDNFKVYDDIACIVLSTKKKGGIEILSCRRAKIEQQKIIGERLFIAKKGDITAHAGDIKTALEELAFKLGDRDASQYKNMPKHTRKSPQDWAFVYRMATGACQYGTQQFMELKGKLKKSYTLTEIIEETKGAYGHDKFCQVVGGK